MTNDNPSPQSPLAVYFCGRQNCLPGHSYGPAIRPHYLIHVVLSGRGIYQYKGTTWHLKKGDAFLIPPMEVTFYQADQSDPWHYAWVGFDGKACQEVLSQTVFSDSLIFKSFGPENAREISEHMERLLQSFAESPGNPLENTGNLLLLLSSMRGQTPKPALSPTALYLQAAKEYIGNNYSYSIKVSDIASYTGIDRTYLYRIFMEQEHISPKQYLLRHRLRMATEMLCSTSYSITEIALSCGFQDASSFCNHFRKSVGRSPKRFRDIIREEETALR